MTTSKGVHFHPSQRGPFSAVVDKKVMLTCARARRLLPNDL